MQRENRKDIIKQRTTLAIPRGPLSGICRFATATADPRVLRTAKSGERNRLGFLMSGLHPTYNGGFTLIELLVVVLIIGILAAVAVPQYRLTVAKTRVMNLVPFVRAIHQAATTYYLANGQYTDYLEQLDIDMPAGHTACPGVAEYKCYDYETYRCMVSGSAGFCTDVLDKVSISGDTNYWACWTSEPVGSIADKVCKNISHGATRNSNNAYVFNRNP